MKIILILSLLLIATAALAQPEVEISAERDSSGKFINATAISVTWEMEGENLKEYQAAEVPDHVSQDDDTLQEWFVQKPNADIYWKFSFTRDVKGEYGLRWRASSDGLWSEWVSVTITKAKEPKHHD